MKRVALEPTGGGPVLYVNLMRAPAVPTWRLPSWRSRARTDWVDRLSGGKRAPLGRCPLRRFLGLRARWNVLELAERFRSWMP